MREDVMRGRGSMVCVTGALLALAVIGCAGPGNGSTMHHDVGTETPDAGDDAASTDDAGSTDDTGAGDDTGTSPSDAGVDAPSDDAGEPWPTCESAPPSATTATLHDIWLADPATPTRYFVTGVYVTAISRGGCTAGSACTIFVQSDTSFADLAAGSQQAIMMFVSANTSTHFTGVAVGDRVDVSGYAWRYDLDGRRDLLLQVNLMLPGCARTTGTVPATPVDVTLSDLTLAAYEDTVGPLLVRVSTVSGRPQLPTETFGLWTTGVFSDAGVTNVVSLSPAMLSGAAFTGLTMGSIHDFTSVTGVFGLFVPPGGAAKYLEIYPRETAEYPVALVH